jgi:hypothetical protein
MAQPRTRADSDCLGHGCAFDIGDNLACRRSNADEAVVGTKRLAYDRRCCMSKASPSNNFKMIDFVQILNFLGCVYAILCAKGGQGRLMADPWWLVPGRTSKELHLIFISQCLNVYGMFLVKASICAYLMALDFGRNYRLLIWASAVIVVLCNFVMMLILHFAYCRPYYSRWDFTVQGKCWPEAVSEATAYVQIASNILTDLVSDLSTFFSVGRD